MSLLLVQLSDIHWRTPADPIASRSTAIATAIQSVALDVSDVFLILCGDIAHSGQASQYKTFTVCFESILSILRGALKEQRIHIVAVPGNHDCDFSSTFESRDLVRRHLPEALSTLSRDTDLIQLLTLVQDDFFQFAESIDAIPSGAHKLYWEVEFETPGGAVRFQCYNTSWTSVLHESPGEILFPVQIAASADPAGRPVAAAVSVLHHPLPWFVPSNRRTVADHLERTSDLVLTGHEHVRSTYTISRPESPESSVRFLEGGALQDKDHPSDSSFRCVLLNLTDRQYKQIVFKWDRSLYTRAGDSEWTAFDRNPALARQAFGNVPIFDQYLTDLGMVFSHPRKAQLFLQDLFVYPDLKRRGVDEEEARTRKRRRMVYSEDVITTILGLERVLIAGQATSGKTTLAKALYSDLRRSKGVVPILLDGATLSDPSPDGLSKAIEAEFVRQYGPFLLERFRQLERSQRAILLDDLHRSPLNRSGQDRLVQMLETYASSVICFADDLYLIDKLTDLPSDSSTPILGRFDIFEIAEFGWRLRSRLISKWHGLGNELHGDEADLRFRSEKSEQLVATLLGRNLLPSLPFTILSILQTSEAATTPATSGGAYGYLYEVLITTALSKISSKAADIDTRYAYISHLAYAVFAAGGDSISVAQLEEASQDYFERMRIKFAVSTEVRELVKARILENQGNTYYFRYKYIYCYFVGRYFRDNRASDPSVIGHIRALADRIHVEEYANIITFYLYLTRDQEVIDYLLSGSRRIFAECRPCDFASDVDFVNKLFKELRPLVLPSRREIDTKREEHRRKRDEEEAEPFEHGELRDVRYADGLSEAVKLNFAFKTLHVLGQVLRNFPGSLPGTVKEEIALECYQLGLRTLKAVLVLAEGNLEGLRYYLAKLIKDKREVMSVAEAAKSADELMIGLTVGCAYGIIYRVAGAVGLKDLRGTYDDVLKRLGAALPERLIDIAIKLEHFRDTPLAELASVSEVSRKNYYVQSVLRDMVANYLYVYRIEDVRVQQKLGEMFGIQSTNVRFMENPSKRSRN